METSIITQIKKKAGELIEPQLLKAGRVLEVRTWQPATMIEVDLHLPFADMQHWTEVPYIKVRVDGLTYRDYTPFGWDADTHTCTLLIDVTHTGPGSDWAKRLKKNDVIHYLKIDTSHHEPDPTALVVGLGDESSMGHLLALQQMTLPHSRFNGAIVISDAEHRNLFGEYFRSPLMPLARHNAEDCDQLFHWVMAQQYCVAHTVFYLAGNEKTVSKLRRLLKDQGYLSGQIKVKGFWS
jgi:NADPH-dependent ferric siderophore reductase